MSLATRKRNGSGSDMTKKKTNEAREGEAPAEPEQSAVSRLGGSLALPGGAPASVQQPPAEERHAGELAFLRAIDSARRPPGWLLSPERVVDFLCGTRGEALRAPAAA